MKRPGKKLPKTILPHYKVDPEYSVEPQDLGKDLEPGLPSKDKKELNRALSKMREEIFHETTSGPDSLTYFMSIDGTINFSTEEVIGVKMNIEDRRVTIGGTFVRGKQQCEVRVEVRTDMEGANTLMNICQRLNDKHQYVIRIFKNDILFRTIQLYDTLLSEVFSEINEDGSNTSTLILNPNYWDM